MNTIDLSTTAQLLLTLASAAVTAAVPILVPYLLKRLHVANLADKSSMESDACGKIVAAAEAAAGVAYQYAVKYVEDGGLANLHVHNSALAAGLSYMVDRVPDALASMHLSANDVTALVDARLGRLLATDPTVTAGQPAATGKPIPLTSGSPPAVDAAADPSPLKAVSPATAVAPAPTPAAIAAAA